MCNRDIQRVIDKTWQCTLYIKTNKVLLKFTSSVYYIIIEIKSVFFPYIEKYFDSELFIYFPPHSYKDKYKNKDHRSSAL